MHRLCWDVWLRTDEGVKFVEKDGEICVILVDGDVIMFASDL